MPTKLKKTRRQFLLGSAALATTGLFAPTTLANQMSSPEHKRLILKNLHTGERCDVTFWENGKYVYSGLAELHKLMRDHRQNEVAEIDPGVYDQMAKLQEKLGHKGEIEIISGFRSDRTNQMLASRSSGVATRSYHTVARAVDLAMPGTDLAMVHRAALDMQAGGVGYYPSSGFVHLDTGPVRRWG